MGLHPEMKSWFKETFPDCFFEDVPPGALGSGLVQVCDAMWILYKFAGDEGATFENLVDHLWRSVSDFYERGGHTFVACFDAAAYVPEAKREEQQKRKRSTEGVSVRLVNDLPQPWRAGLADAVVREVKSYLNRENFNLLQCCDELEQFSREHKDAVAHFVWHHSTSLTTFSHVVFSPFRRPSCTACATRCTNASRTRHTLRRRL